MRPVKNLLSIFIIIGLLGLIGAVAGCGGGGDPGGGSSSGISPSVQPLGHTLTGKIVLPDGSSGPGILVMASRVDEGSVSSKQAKVLAAKPAGKTQFTRTVKTAAGSTEGSYATVTDADGIYILTGLDTGTYYIEASRGGLKAKGRGTVSPLEATVVDMALTPTGGITGYCLLQGASPLGNAGTFVVIKGTDYIGFTDDDGSFILDQIPVGSYQVSFVHPGYESADYPSSVSVPTADLAELDSVYLTPLSGGTVTGTVAAQDQESLEEVMVVVKDEDGGQYFTTTDDLGEYRTDGVKPGSVTVGFKHDLIDEGFLSDPVQVTEGGQHTVDATLTDLSAPVWEGAPGVVYVTEIDDANGGQTVPAGDTISVAVEFGRAEDASVPLTFLIYHNAVENWDAENWENNIQAEYPEDATYAGIRGDQGVVLQGLPAAGRFVFGVRVKDRHGKLEYNRSEYLYVAGESGPTAQERDNLLTAVGNIGIGTKDPQGLLHVEAADGSAFVVDDQTGNVGIGTTDPHAALTVGSIDQQQTQPGSTSGTFAVDSAGTVISGAWQGDAIADDYIETVSGSKITGDIAASQVVGDIPSSQIVGAIPSTQITGDIPFSQIAGSIPTSQLTGPIAGASVEGDIAGNATGVTGVVPLVNGGTGATTAEQARTNLGIDSLTATVSGGPGGSIEDGTITTDDIATGAITSDDIATGAITSDDIATGTITAADIAPGTITDAEISAAAAIAGSKISPDFGSRNIITMGKMGISTADPKADLHVVGSVIVGPAFGITAEAGMVQFDGTGFKGYDGLGWKSLDTATIAQEALDADDLSDNFLSDLSDVSDVTPGTDQVLKWTGAAWTPAADTTLEDSDIATMGYIKTDIDTTLSDNDIGALGYIKTYTETDPTVDLAKLKTLVTNDFHNLGGTDADTTLSDNEIGAMGYIKTDTNLEDADIEAMGYIKSVIETDPTVDLAKLKALVTDDFHNLGGTDADTQLTDSDIAALGYIKTDNDTTYSAGTNITFDGTTINAAGDGHSLNAADADPVDAVYVNNLGNVGVGTTSPQDVLHVNGDIRLDGSKLNVNNAADQALELINRTNGGFKFWTDDGSGAPEVTITGDGKVGVGTNVPLNKLVVSTTTNNDGLSLINTAGYNTYIRFYEGTSVKSAIIYGGGNDTLKLASPLGGALTLGDQTTEVVRITGGNVGIGSDAPGCKLDVAGGVMISNTGATFEVTETVKAETSGDTITNAILAAGTGTGTAGSITQGVLGKAYYNGTSTATDFTLMPLASGLFGKASTGTDQNPNGSIASNAVGVSGTAATTQLGSNTGVIGTARGGAHRNIGLLSLTNLSDVDIIAAYTALPVGFTAALYANNSQTGATDFAVFSPSAGKSYFAGSVGIGSDAPGYKLDVAGAVRATTFIGDGSGLTGLGSAGGVINEGATTVGADDHGVDPPDGTGEVVLQTRGDTRLIVANDGSIGIGTESPGALLDVQGAAQFGTGNVALIDATGKIAGISSAYFASLDGSALTNLNAGSLASGTVDNTLLDAELQDLADGQLTAALVEHGGLFITTPGTAGQVWKSDGDGAGVWGPDAINDAVDGTELDGVFSTNGFLSRTGTGTYATVTDNSSNWDTAYTAVNTKSTNWDTAYADRLKWDGGGSGLDAAAGRVSLELGSAATAEVTEFMAADTDNWVDTGGDTMTGTLNLPANGLIAGTDQLVLANGKIGIGTTSPTSLLTVGGTVEITSIGLKFPDGSLQAKAAIGDGHSLDADDGNPVDSVYVNQHGAVGIGGITAPSARLVVAGMIRAEAGAPAVDLNSRGFSFRNPGDMDGGMFSNADNTLLFATNGVTRMAIKGGNVGIGTGDPAQSLEVVGNASGGLATPLYLRNKAALAAGNGVGIRFGAASGASGVVGQAVIRSEAADSPNGAGNLVFSTFLDGSGMLDRMIINQNGKVGIGTADPQDVLDVNGHLALKGRYLQIYSGYDSGSGYSHNGIKFNCQWTGSNDVYVHNGPAAIIAFNKDDNHDGEISFATFPSGTAGSVLGTAAKMTLKNNGNVGIGTTAPTAKLHVIGTVKATAFSGPVNPGFTSGSVVFQGGSGLAQDNGGFFWDDSNNRLGIGTVSPEGILHMVRSGTPVVHLQSTATSGTMAHLKLTGARTGADAALAKLVFFNNETADDGGANAVIQVLKGADADSAGIDFQTRLDTASALTSALFIEETGYVGIGTTDPGGKLHVMGDANTYIKSQTTGDGDAGFHMKATSVGDETGGINQYAMFIQGANNSGDLRINEDYVNGTWSPTTRLIIQNDTGNVGIGTGDPGAKLDVNGTVKATAFAGPVNPNFTAGSVVFQGAGGLAQDNANLFWDDTNNRLGVGTTGPESLLQVHNTSAGADTYFTGSEIVYKKADNSSSYLDKMDTGDLVFRMGAGFDEKMRLTNAGKLGLGTDAPAQKLHVAGARQLLTNPSAGATTFFEVSDSPDLNNNNYILFGVDITGGAMGYGSGGAFMSVGKNGTGTARDLVLHQYDAKSIILATTNTERVRIDADGNVGIGTSAPAADLHVKGIDGIRVSSGAAAPKLILYDEDDDDQFKLVHNRGDDRLEIKNAASTELMTVSKAGKIGIGTTGPNVKLAVAGQIRAASGTPTGNQNAHGYTFRSPGDMDGGMFSDADDTLLFATNGITRMAIKGANVGIGTIAPSTLLEVNGTATFAALGITTEIQTDTISEQTTDAGVTVDGVLLKDNIVKGKRITLQDSGSTVWGMYVTPGSGDYFQISDSNDDSNPKLVINKMNGKVGIGTTAPASNLQIGGSNNVSKTLTIKATNETDDSNYGTANLVLWGHRSGATEPANIVFKNYYNTSAPTIDIAQITADYEGSNTGGRLDFYTADTAAALQNRMTITKTGKIGIGTTAPDEELHISGGSTTRLHVESTSTSPATLWLSTPASSYMWWANGTADQIQLKNHTAGTQLMTVTADGNVGIGTTAPTYALEVKGEARFEDSSKYTLGNHFYMTKAHDTNRAYQYIGRSRGTSASPTAVVDGDGLAGIGFRGYDGSAYQVSAQILASVDGAVTAGSVPTMLNFTTGTGNGGGSRMTITSSGNVGIGTTAPAAPLHVVGVSAGGAHGLIVDGDGGGGDEPFQIRTNTTISSITDADIKFIVMGDGQVGIGTSNPAQKLDVRGHGYFNSGSSTQIQIKSATAETRLYSHSDGKTYFQTQGALSFNAINNTANPRMYITTGGNVGIQTLAPAAKLHIAASYPIIRFDDNSGDPQDDWDVGVNINPGGAGVVWNKFLIWNQTDNAGVSIGADGKVGIGTTGPSKKLEISATSSVFETHMGMHNQTNAAGEGTGIDFSLVNQIDPAYMGSLVFVRNSVADGTGNFHFLSDSGLDGLTLDDATLTIKNDGNVGIGTSTPTNPLVVGPDYGTTYSGNKVTIADTTGVPGVVVGESDSVRGWLLWSTTSDYLYLGTMGNAATQVIKDGKVGIGTTAPAYLLHVNGTAGKPGGGSWTAASDERLKTDISGIKGREALDKITSLRGVNFRWKNPGEHGEGVQAGVLAQDLEKVFPGWVTRMEPMGEDRALVPEGERVRAVSFPHDFNAYLIEAIKELKGENDALKARNTEIMSRLEALEARKR